MIYFDLSITNPFSGSNEFKNLVCKSGSITENKSWEVECYTSNILFECNLTLNFRGDHAGIRVDLGFLGYTIAGQIYDNRHWNYAEDRYCNKYDEMDTKE